MIAIETSMFVEGITGEEVFDFLLGTTDEDYRRWWPGTHLRLHALKRGENHVGDVFYMDEYIGERRVRMKGVVVEAERGRSLVWQFKRLVRLPVRLTLEMKDRDGGVSYGLTPVGLAASMALRSLLTGSPLDVGTTVALLVFGAVSFAPLAFFFRGIEDARAGRAGVHGSAASLSGGKARRGAS